MKVCPLKVGERPIVWNTSELLRKELRNRIAYYVVLSLCIYLHVYSCFYIRFLNTFKALENKGRFSNTRNFLSASTNIHTH